MIDYDKQAKDFCSKTGTEVKIEFLKYDYYFNDKDKRDIYGITLIKGDRSYYFTFGNSINDSGFKLRYKSGTAKGKEVKYTWMNDAITQSKGDLKKFTQICLQKFGSMGNLEILPPKPPTEYDILSCLTKYDPESFKDFCDDYGYNTDSIQAKETYEKVVDEYRNIERLYSQKEIEIMRDIE